MNLQTLQSPSPSYLGMVQPNPGASGMESVVLRPLKSSEEIETILHLRDQIDLSAHTGAGSDFAWLEKKETSWALFVPSRLAGN